MKKKNNYTGIFILTDRNVASRYKKILARIYPSAVWIIMPPGEKNKNLLTCEKIWKTLTLYQADRNSLLINFGGGVICDTGGFVASVYKRGIPFINIPTTLMAMADAAIGGKNGVDFLNFKNQIGLFQEPVGIYINPVFLNTLPQREYLSGWAEIVKHTLISDKKKFFSLPRQIPGVTNIHSYLTDSFRYKSMIAGKDPYEKGIRKILNFGHTIGHAIESAFLHQKKPVTHGEAVAAGMICEAWISYKKKMLPLNQLQKISEIIQRYFSKIKINKRIEKDILKNIYQDKKNRYGKIQCVLLSDIGKPLFAQEISEAEVMRAVRYYQDN